MFVTHCRVDFEDTVVIAAEQTEGRKRRRGHKEGHSQLSGPEETFHPVYCELCSARLGLYDSEEVFHFVSVVASEP